MTRTKRIFTIIGAFFAIQGSLILMLAPEYALQIIAAGVGFTLACYGLKYLVYYLTHAQHMVGGKWFLLIGLFMLDAGIFAGTIYDKATVITILYIAGAHLIGAGLNIVRAVGNRKDNNRGWKTDMAQGIGNIILVVLCIIFMHDVIIPVYIYCVSAIYTAILMLISAFKKTAIVYVQ